MITRSIDAQNDWNFGKGSQNYLGEKNALAQNLKTRIQSFYRDCFFDLNAGIDWFTFLGSKNQNGLKNAIAKTILNTVGVYSLDELNFSLSEKRELLIQYQVTTIWSETLTSSITLGQ